MTITKELTKKNMITGKEYSACGLFSDEIIAIFKTSQGFAIAPTSYSTKTVTAKDKQNAKFFEVLEFQKRTVGVIKAVQEDGTIYETPKNEYTIKSNGKLIAIITVFGEI